ncbi:MAG: hypothetical protein M1816_007244 [Peltula sp. TS41687]|nr:MAG: hypothetical protein M1816_007244 [Peltula sp. TS41687]
MPPGRDVSVDHKHRIIIRHPGYASEYNILIILQAPDHSDGGLVYDTAHTIYDVLPVGEYYFHLPGGIDQDQNDRYPVIGDPSLRRLAVSSRRPCLLAGPNSRWTIPPTSHILVAPTRASTVICRDRTCRLTKTTKKGRRWPTYALAAKRTGFERNNMRRYINAQKHPHGVDDAHGKRAICCAPTSTRASSSARSSSCPSPPNGSRTYRSAIRSLIRLSHNVELQPAERACPRNVSLARLGLEYSFRILRVFLRHERLLCVRVDDSCGSSEGQKKEARRAPTSRKPRRARRREPLRTGKNIKVAQWAGMSDDERRWQHLRATSLLKGKGPLGPAGGRGERNKHRPRKAFRSTLSGNDALRLYAAMGADVRLEEDEP